jgi:hypothetical protein
MKTRRGAEAQDPDYPEGHMLSRHLKTHMGMI